MDDYPNLLKGLQSRLDANYAATSELKLQLNRICSVISSGRDPSGLFPTDVLIEATNNLRSHERNHHLYVGSPAGEAQHHREMTRLQHARNAILASPKSQEELEQLKQTQVQLFHRKRDLEAAAEEMLAGIRRIRSAITLHCSTSDIVELACNISPEKVTVVSGKGGANIRSIESKCRVIIDIDKTEGVRLLGTQDAVLLASSEINNLFNNSVEEIFVSDDKIVCLVLKKAQQLLHIQSSLSVRIDISRARGSCKIYGHYDSVKAAVSLIKGLDTKKIEIKYSDDMVSFIFGRGDCAFRDLEANLGVQIEFDKDAQIVSIMGLREAAEAAATSLQALLDENKDVEETLDIGRVFLLSGIIGPGGSTARRLQRDLGIILCTIGLDDETVETVQLILHGPAQKVSYANEHIRKLCDDFKRRIFELKVSDDIIPKILGKKGSRIQQLRTTFPDATIELVGDCLRVQSEIPESVASIRDAFESIIAENFTLTFPLNSELLIVFKGHRGRLLRDCLRSTLKLFSECDDGAGVVVLRGTQDNVLSGIRELDKFVLENAIDQLPADREDRIAFQKPANPDISVAKVFENAFKIEILFNKKEHHIQLMGYASDIAEAKRAIREYIDGDICGGSKVLVVSPALINRLLESDCAQLKELERRREIKIDIKQSSHSLRIRPYPFSFPVTDVKSAVAILEFAAADIKTLEQNLSLTRIYDFGSELKLDGDSISEVSWQLIYALSDTLQVTIEKVSATSVQISGPTEIVRFTSLDIRTILTGMMTSVVHLTASQIDHVLQSPEYREYLVHLTSLDVPVKVSSATDGLVLEGIIDYVLAVKIDLFKILDNILEGQCLSLTVDPLDWDAFATLTLEAEISNLSGALVYGDRQFSCIRIHGQQGDVQLGWHVAKEKYETWSQSRELIKLSDAALVEVLNNSVDAMAEFEIEFQVHISFVHRSQNLFITGKDSFNTFMARRKIEEWLGAQRTCCWSTAIPVNSVGAFIGKGGNNIKQLRQETGAIVEFDSLSSIVSVTGLIHSLEAARERITSFLENEHLRRFSLTVSVSSSVLSRLNNSLASVLPELQLPHGLRLDVDSSNSEIVLKGSPEKCLVASENLRKLLKCGDHEWRPTAGAGGSVKSCVEQNEGAKVPRSKTTVNGRMRERNK